jgi:hypothetical protein
MWERTLIAADMRTVSLLFGQYDRPMGKDTLQTLLRKLHDKTAVQTLETLRVLSIFCLTFVHICAMIVVVVRVRYKKISR